MGTGIQAQTAACGASALGLLLITQLMTTSPSCFTSGFQLIPSCCPITQSGNKQVEVQGFGQSLPTMKHLLPAVRESKRRTCKVPLIDEAVPSSRGSCSQRGILKGVMAALPAGARDRQPALGQQGKSRWKQSFLSGLPGPGV